MRKKTYRKVMTTYRPPVKKERRGTAASRGYGSRWDKYTARFLQKNPQGGRIVCIACIGTMTNAWCVDHIIPVRQNEDRPQDSGACDEIFWPAWNHQPLCRLHHTQKTHIHDPWYSENRFALIRTAQDMLQANVPDHEIRNWLIQQNEMWPDGWFDLDPDPNNHMQTLGV